MLMLINEYLGLVDLLNVVLPSALLLQHVKTPYVNVRYRVGLGLIVTMAILEFVLVLTGEKIRLMALVTMLYAYCVALFMLISDVLLWGGAEYLTRKRGSKWVKELDYIYLTLGAVGVFGSLTRFEVLTGRFTKFDILGPLFLATALVLRFIKTRVEIEGWNNLPSTTSTTPPAAPSST